MTIASYIMILQIDLLHSSVFGYELLLYIGEIYLKGDEHFDLQVQKPCYIKKILAGALGSGIAKAISPQG